jgi:hypothetical protein
MTTPIELMDIFDEFEIFLVLVDIFNKLDVFKEF